ncbi:alpha/beta hydrolase [Candidatus Enterococcus ikei]|uniref:Alpha/beta hydrolase n=1 Tax=Candidatus Enterococcus ikei TaxID=2815326 RepID=A0ABS3GW20_9ENTE|nr:alpha/beta hydrolase [Enterococcus sp. DIV0869a]MBO0439459.1 alpha/beta hydrolase [Enterococcus sp. DIV0869a]
MKKRAILIIHGFGGNEKEILYLHNHLKQSNLDSFWIQLTGHDGIKENFSKATSDQWLADVERKLDELEQEYLHITCIGFSMGGLLTILASEREAVDQLVLCSTPIYLYNAKVIMQDIVQGLFFNKQETLDYYFSSAKTVSIRSCVHFLSVLQRTKKKLNRTIQMKANKKMLILQNRQDETTYYKSAYYLAKATKAQVSVKIYENGRHQLFLGENRTIAVEDIKKFILH